MSQQKGTAFRPKRIRKSIKLDRVQAADLRQLNMVYACEECSHFCPEKNLCTIGFPSDNHLKTIQDQRFQSHGHMAFCRFHEID